MAKDRDQFFNDDATRWTQAYFQGHITAQIDALFDRMEKYEYEKDQQWDVMRRQDKDRQECRGECDKKIGKMKILSAITTSVVMICTFILSMVARIFGFRSNVP